MKKNYITGHIHTVAGKVPVVSTLWTSRDIISTIKVRWSWGRNHYRVKQGLYATGSPDENSNVFVTANFKLSFDHLLRALNGMNAWILVLDTKGINVWCAAGKGTFGTKELVYRIKAHELGSIVSHRKVILPQLGATGVSANKVKKQTGFHVIYGPVRAEDIPAFVSSGFKATPEMRKVRFNFVDRAKLIPVEIAGGKNYLFIALAIIFILSGLNPHGYSIDIAWQDGGKSVVNLLAAYIGGCVLTPLLFPWIPFRMFFLKGLTVGWIIAALLMFVHFMGNNLFGIISWYLIMGGISSFLAMNFTGSSTFTSLSGVRKEMKIALPVQIGSAGVGLIGWVVARFIS